MSSPNSVTTDRRARVAVLGLMVLTMTVALVAVTMVAPRAGGASVAHAAGSVAPPAAYYVAMGDSMAAGVGASDPAHDYVDVVYQHELVRYPGLQLVNISCSGATTGSVVNGPGCAYTTGTQPEMPKHS